LRRTRIQALLAAGVIATLTLIFTVTAQQPRSIDANILKTAGTDKDALPGTWLTYGLTQTEQRYSPLKQIDATNVGKLGLAWSAPLVDAAAGGRGGTEGTPLVWNNTIYQPMDNSIVYAIDARTGQQKWMYDAKIDAVTRSRMCCGTHNRGLAISDGKIILAANDARLIALDAITGKELWQTRVADINMYYSMAIAPRIAGDKVVIGIAGGEYFIRGFFAAYNLKDGSLAWKFYTVPPAPGQPFEDEAQEKAAKTWTGDWAKYGGGGPVWDGLVYDPDTNLVIAGTGNAEPWPQEMRGHQERRVGQMGQPLYLLDRCCGCENRQAEVVLPDGPPPIAGISTVWAVSSWRTSRSAAEHAKSSCRRRRAACSTSSTARMESSSPPSRSSP
jgi:quinohemoprotein ethanol dehydrogenase